VLKNFYLKVRPWGFWGPIHDKVAAEYSGIERNNDFKRDMLNVAVGIIWQTALTATGIFLVIQEYTYMTLCVVVVLVTMAFLKTNWYDNLEDYPDEYAKNADTLIETKGKANEADLFSKSGE
jgi:hypothetical protein